MSLVQGNRLGYIQRMERIMNRIGMVSRSIGLREPEIIYYSSDKPFTYAEINNPHVERLVMGVSEFVANFTIEPVVTPYFHFEGSRSVDVFGYPYDYHAPLVIEERDETGKEAPLFFTLRLGDRGTDIEIDIMYEAMMHNTFTGQPPLIYLGACGGHLASRILDSIVDRNEGDPVSVYVARKIKGGSNGVGHGFEEKLDAINKTSLYNKLAKIISKGSKVLLNKESELIVINTEGNFKGITRIVHQRRYG